MKGPQPMPMTPKGPGPIRPQVPQSAPGPQQQMTPMGPGRQMIATPIGFNMRQQTPMMQQQQQSGLIHRPVGMMPQQTMPYRRTPYPIINHNQKGMLEKMVDYLVGDGANSRFAMICKECLMHNGEFKRSKPFEQLFNTVITFQEWPSRRSTSTRRSGAPSAVRSTRPKSSARWPLGFRSSRLSWTRCCGRSVGRPPPPQTRNRRPPPRTATVPKPMQVRTTLTCSNKLQSQHISPSNLPASTPEDATAPPAEDLPQDAEAEEAEQDPQLEDCIDDNEVRASETATAATGKAD